jgi:hypothetical protein
MAYLHLYEKFLEVQKPFFKKVFGRRRHLINGFIEFNYQSPNHDKRYPFKFGNIFERKTGTKTGKNGDRQILSISKFFPK